MRNSAITRTVWILSLISLFADISSELLYPVVPVYLRSIGFSFFLIGVLEGVAETTAGLSKGTFGHWSDHYGHRTPFIRYGYLLSALSKPMMALLTFPAWIFFSRFLDRIGKGLRTAPRDALLSRESTPSTKAQVFGFHRALDTIGAVVGPALALLYMHTVSNDISRLFLIAFVPGLIAVGITFFIRERRALEKPIAEPLPSPFRYLSYIKICPHSFRTALLPFVVFALFNSSDMFLLLQVKEATGSTTMPIVAYIVYNIVYALAAYPIGMLADAIGIRRVIVAGMILFSLCYYSMTIAHDLIGFAGVFFIYGIAMAAIESNVKAWLSNMVDAKEVGTALGFFVSLQSVSLLVASSCAGLMWTLYGASTTFLVTSTAGIISAVLLLRHRGRTQSEVQESLALS